jgi:hypothetical protein
MKTALRLFVAVSVAITVSLAQGAEAQQHVDRGPLPSSLSAMVTTADVVVVGTVTDVSVLRGPATGEPKLTDPMTRVMVFVTEVIKGDPSALTPGMTISVLLFGADAKTAEPGLGEPLKKEQLTLMALTYWAARAEYVLRYGADSVFEVTDGRIHARGRSQLAHSLKGKGLGDIVDELKRLKRPR